jgi:exosome complex RNA-binding protein Csl4
VESARRGDHKETAAQWQLNSGLREAEFGNSELARQQVKAALAISSSRDTQIFAALTLARVGDIARAQVMSEELANFRRIRSSTTTGCLRSGVTSARGWRKTAARQLP